MSALARLRFRAANAVWLAGQRAGHRAFLAALGLPARMQAARLHATLERNAESDYGRRYGFARIRTFREYQEANEFAVGVNYFFKGQNLKLQTDLSWYNGGNPAAGVAQDHYRYSQARCTVVSCVRLAKGT